MYIALVLYVCFSALGLTLIKLGINQSFRFAFQMGTIKLELGIYLIIGLILYIISFLLSLIAMSKMNLTSFYPIAAGTIYILVCILGVAFLKEKISYIQLMGIGLILAGIVIMNLKKG